MRRILWVLVALAGLAAAQETTEPKKAPVADPGGIVSKIIPIRYVNVSHMREILSIPGVQIRADSEMHVLVVSGPRDYVATLEEMAKKLDVAPTPPPPHPDIELTVYLVFGSPQAKSEEIPPELVSTIKQLHGSFGYKSYRVADSFVLRGRDGESGRTSGVIAGSTEMNSTYSFSYLHATVSNELPRVIRIDNLDAGLRVPRNGSPGNFVDSVLRTSIDVREGQKVVVGKSNINGSDEALILVVTAKVVE